MSLLTVVRNTWTVKLKCTLEFPLNGTYSTKKKYLYLQDWVAGETFVFEIRLWVLYGSH